jgi:hypothetical protein
LTRSAGFLAGVGQRTDSVPARVHYSGLPRPPLLPHLPPATSLGQTPALGIKRLRGLLIGNVAWPYVRSYAGIWAFPESGNGLMRPPRPDIYGYTIFCDDIRHELGGKTSYIGCYSGTIFLHQSFPFTFPKFCFAISILQRREIFDPNVEMRVYLPGDGESDPSFSVFAQESSPGAIAEQTAKAVEGMPIADQRVIAMHMSSPLVIKEAGPINVRGVRQGESIRLGGVRVVPHPSIVPKDEAAN